MRSYFAWNLEQGILSCNTMVDTFFPVGILFFSILLTHEGSHREAYRDFQPSLTSSAGGAKGFSDHRFHAPPAYPAQLLTLHQHRANNQYRTANQI